MAQSSESDIRDFAFYVFERTLSQPRPHLRSHLAMQRLSSEATISCPNRDAPALPEHDQRAAKLFFNGVVITKSSIELNSHVVYVDYAFITQKFLDHSIDKLA